MKYEFLPGTSWVFFKYNKQGKGRVFISVNQVKFHS